MHCILTTPYHPCTGLSDASALVGRSQVFSNNQSMDLMVSEDQPYADAARVSGPSQSEGQGTG